MRMRMSAVEKYRFEDNGSIRAERGVEGNGSR
jgi:hypothetical protein